ncbi:MAG: glucose 1-dehydrogenase [Sphingomonadales bacterium]|nr:glucose 1-dehydrogenase [Sphingomonadales bacterium]MBU3991920.1 glucose 1-dehydrogenase [Alphaproteobacteria bacterium]
MQLKDIDFSGRVAIVTGGSTGIGLASARQFAHLGAKVVIASRNAENLAAAAAQITSETGAPCLSVPTDVRDETAVIALVEQTVAAFGRVDILINNAGGTRMAPLETIPTKAWEASFALNVHSAYFATREAGRHMIAQGSGAIVNVSSMAGHNGVTGGAHYASSKAALEMFTLATAVDWGRYGIRCNCVAPGLIASERAVVAWDVGGIPSEALARTIPLRRVGTPEELSNAVVFLASDAAAYITGQVLPVDGGPQVGGVPLD